MNLTGLKNDLKIGFQCIFIYYCFYTKFVIMNVSHIANNLSIRLCFLVLFLSAGGCQEKKKEVSYPVYSVDLDRVEQPSVFDVFSHVEVYPLETTEKSRLESIEWGIHNDRFIILDKPRGLCFCFGTDGKFRYVVDNKVKKKKNEAKMPDGSKPVSILSPLSYYYNNRWHYYLTFRNLVYTKNKKGAHIPLFRWDFGKYNDKEGDLPAFPSHSRVWAATIQRLWMEENCDFALSEGKQNDQYIYLRIERLFKERELLDTEQFVHLFWNKSTGTYQLFDRFAGGGELPKITRMNDTCMLALIPYAECGRYIRTEWLAPEDAARFRQMKPGDNPLIVKYYFKKTAED